MKNSIKLSTFLVGTLLLLAAISPALALSSQISATEMNIASINGGTASSYNWAGYAVTGSAVTSVSGQWTVPTTTSPDPTSTTTYYAAYWVGIDGFGSSTVEQTGILAMASGTTTTYVAWFEFYPGPMYEIGTTVHHHQFTPAPVQPGDVITASVTYGTVQASPSSTLSNTLTAQSGVLGSSSNAFNSQSNNHHSKTSNVFTVTITDTTQGWTYSTSASVSGATRTSAEWIAEAPSSSGGILPLANFGNNPGISFSSCSAVASSGTLTPSSSGATEITMVNYPAGTSVMAQPSGATGNAFSVEWLSAGP